MREIVINSKKHGICKVLVDDEDYDKINMFKWVLSGRDEKSIYAHRRMKKDESNPGKCIYLHREILNITNSDIEIDHIDGNTKNNQKTNLRICSRLENSRNTVKRENCASKYKGVSWNKVQKKWRVRINVAKTEIHIGFYSREDDAGMAYNEAAILHFGEFARLNILPHDYIDMRPKRRQKTSKYKGISFIPKSRKWRAVLYVGRVKINVGNFNSEDEAFAARNLAKNKYLGEDIDA